MPTKRTPKTAASALAIGLASAGAFAAPAFATACTDLANTPLTLGGTATTVSFTAKDIPAGPFTAPNGQAFAAVPAFCEISLVISSSGNPATSQSAVEIWLPRPSHWNRRYEGFGNGGFAGAIDFSELLLGISEGFASANTDLGTGILFKCNSAFCGDHTGFGGIPGGLYGDPAAIRDFGYAATHLMTLAAKQVTAEYYLHPPKRSYFNGCSTGGQQALMESQRFPDDYDGILAGAPAHNRTHLHMAGPAVYEATHFAADAYLTNAALGLSHSLVLRKCAGLDGGLRTDDFLTQPNMCKADARDLICQGKPADVPCTDPTAASCTCLTHNEATAMNKLWSGAVDNNGNQLYPGGERGTEEPVPLSAANGYSGNLGLPWQQAFSEPVFDSLMYWALGPKWVWQEMFDTTSTLQPELASEIATVDATPVGDSTFAGVLNANNTNLRYFANHGHRILMYQGYADPLIPSATSIDYYNAVAAGDPKVNDYLRLFLAPGVWHCGGGPGANAFGNLSSTLPPEPLNPHDDVLGALIYWVEVGTPPTVIRATKFTNDDPASGIAFQRPLCLYPAHAVYAGGNKAVFGSYKCVSGAPVTNQPFSPIYGP
jgi:feruloyl esterase